MLPYSDDMSFYERYYNTMLSAYNWIVRRLYYIPSEEMLAKKYFSHLEPLPSLDELIRNVSVVFVNAHRAISPPRPTMPGSPTYSNKTKLTLFFKFLAKKFSQKLCRAMIRVILSVTRCEMTNYQSMHLTAAIYKWLYAVAIHH